MTHLLSELEKGQEASIVSLLSRPGKEELFQNILDIGLLPGTKVLVLEKYSSQKKSFSAREKWRSQSEKEKPS